MCKVERGAEEDRCSNGAQCPRVSVGLGCVIDIGAALQHVKAAAEQFKDLDRWGCLLRYISHRIAPIIAPPRPLPSLPETG